MVCDKYGICCYITLIFLAQNHSMIRVKDPEKSLSFYQDVMGMKLKRTSENKGANFNLYFLGYGADASTNSPNGVNPVADQEGLLELTWNYGTENDESFKYHDGNAEPQGFGHICVTVDDLDAACSRFEEKDVSPFSSKQTVAQLT
jgi:lactoylglutathione lyase